MSIYSFAARATSGVMPILTPLISNDQKKSELTEDIKTSTRLGLLAAQTAVIAPLAIITPAILLSAAMGAGGPIGGFLMIVPASEIGSDIAQYYSSQKEASEKVNQLLFNPNIFNLSIGTGVLAGLFFNKSKAINKIGKMIDNRKISDMRFWMATSSYLCAKYCFDAARFAFAISFGANFSQTNASNKSEKRMQTKESDEYSNLFYKLANPRLKTSEILQRLNSSEEV